MFNFELNESIPDDTIILKSQKTGKVIAKIVNIGKEDIEIDDDKLIQFGDPKPTCLLKPHYHKYHWTAYICRKMQYWARIIKFALLGR